MSSESSDNLSECLSEVVDDTFLAILGGDTVHEEDHFFVFDAFWPTPSGDWPNSFDINYQLRFFWICGVCDRCGALSDFGSWWPKLLELFCSYFGFYFNGLTFNVDFDDCLFAFVRDPFPV